MLLPLQCAATAAAATAGDGVGSAADEGAAAPTLGALTRDRVSAVLDPHRASVLNAALGNTTTTPTQALAVNNLLGVCGIPGWPTGHGEMGAWKGMCRVQDER